MTPFVARSVQTVVPSDDVALRPGEFREVAWYPDYACELVDVRLVRVEGPVDVRYVLVGVDIQPAFARRKRLVVPGQYITVQLHNYGAIGASCGVELDVARSSARPEQPR